MTLSAILNAQKILQEDHELQRVRGRGQKVGRQVAHVRFYAPLVLALGFVPGLNAADLYRLTDEHGKVIYTDQIPPSQAKKGYGVLDSQGREKGQVAPELSAEARAEQERERAAQEAAQRAAEEQMRRENLLLQLYGSEDAIKQARESMLQTTESKRRIHEMNASSLRKRIEFLLEQAAQGKPQSKELVSLKKDLAVEEVAISRVDAEKDAINTHFDKIQAKWRIAKARHEGLYPKIAPSAPVTDTFLLLSPTFQPPEPVGGVEPKK
ncbi:MAG TPA: DUF4124 domain-containing protein [bacterium]|nr:DUF4124 domain-containing protein [bacterium]